MKIDAIRVTRATMPRVDPQWRTASYAANVVNALILEVQAAGLTGIGSAVARPNGTPVEEFESDCDGPVRELLIGRDPLERTSIYEALERSPINRAVLSAVDVALHD